MTAPLPEFFFRVRDGGAAVFRVDAENRQRRLEMEQIAVVNLGNGRIRPQGGRVLSAAETAAIEAWMAARREELAARRIDDIFRAVDHLNLTAHWAQTEASRDEIETVADALLLAMHDLRMVLVRRKAEGLERPAAEDDDAL